MQRERDFNFGWRFSLEDQPAHCEKSFDDGDWREVRLPHDWSVEQSFDEEKGEGATGYLVGGIGWYRKRFATPEGARDVLSYVLFDGVYNNSEVWINGNKLGFHPYGYSPFYYDLTQYLNRDGGDNVLAVRVDHSRYVDSRWYTGSGIYRSVSLVTLNKVHVPIWGCFVTTPEVSEEKATVSIELDLRNASQSNEDTTLTLHLIAPDGEEALSSTERAKLAAGEESKRKHTFAVANPKLWDLESPHLYRVVATITQGGEVLDTHETIFGIRSIRFDVSEGFFLNGRNTLIKGVCLHHDAGLVGAAVPKGVWRRRFQTLKDGGCNAIRIAHNPGSTEFIDLCDEMGILVQNEFFDEWDNPKDKRLNKEEQSVDFLTRGYCEHFHEWAERDLKAVMLRDRNHPSIIQWSIGNEIEWTYPRDVAATGFFNMSWEGNYFWEQPPRRFDEIKAAYESSPKEKYTLADTAHRLAGWTRELDTTRPVTANCILPSISHVSGYADALDIVGYSYRRVMYDPCHKAFPDKVIMGAENLGQWHEWKAILERPFVCGTFLWTGIDYMGEVNGQWPTRSLAAGLLDTAGFTKASWHQMKTLWKDDEPHVHLVSQVADKSIFKVDSDTGNVVEKKPGAWEQALWIWHDVNEHWNYEADEPVIVEVYSNCAEVELFLNGESFGVKRLQDFEDHIYKWALPFRAGKLEAKAAGASVAIATAEEPASIVLDVDRELLAADAYDVAHVVAQLVDARGVPVLLDDRELEFEVSGPSRILGVDTGDPQNVQDFQSNRIVTKKGRCLLILQSLEEPGSVSVEASSPGLRSASVKIQIRTES